mmetsp:Transcript_42900/g.86290  ORF Transcript_42900/g.86290 Transcript_42900/m.86290 type:complete len:114 (+) Transcript_42900:336-677(+)
MRQRKSRNSGGLQRKWPAKDSSAQLKRFRSRLSASQERTSATKPKMQGPPYDSPSMMPLRVFVSCPDCLQTSSHLTARFLGQVSDREMAAALGRRKKEQGDDGAKKKKKLRAA